MTAAVGLVLQWLTLGAFAVLGLVCAMVIWRVRWARGMAAAWMAVAINNGLLYIVAFLIWPELLGAVPTLVWSAAARIHIALTAMYSRPLTWSAAIPSSSPMTSRYRAAVRSKGHAG